MALVCGLMLDGVLGDVQVVRYSALLGGVFYGITHRRTLQKQKDEAQKHDAVHHREELIHKAKEAWKLQLAAPKDACMFLCSSALILIQVFRFSRLRHTLRRPHLLSFDCFNA
jgi:F-type H+-transporting ATP synthase subunit e